MAKDILFAEEARRALERFLDPDEGAHQAQHRDRQDRGGDHEFRHRDAAGVLDHRRISIGP